MLGVHFTAHYLFLPGLKVWTETVECSCSEEDSEELPMADTEEDFNLMANKEEGKVQEKCFCNVNDLDRKEISEELNDKLSISFDYSF